MLVLGLETSCDETGVALYDSERGLLADALFSQIDLHRAYGGVVPELASRDHVKRMLPLIRQVLAEADCVPTEIDAIAYTAGPGLVGALLVGASCAQALAFAWGIPALGVHHMEGHLLAPMLEEQPPEFPFVALLVSGGHTQLVRVDGIGQYELLGETLDDAAGEAFDKTAKMMGLNFATPESARIMMEDIRDMGVQKTVGFKPAGGVRTAEDAQLFLSIADELFGADWADSRHYRFGASSLLASLLKALGHGDGKSASAY